MWHAEKDAPESPCVDFDIGTPMRDIQLTLDLSDLLENGDEKPGHQKWEPIETIKVVLYNADALPDSGLYIHVVDTNTGSNQGTGYLARITAVDANGAITAIEQVSGHMVPANMYTVGSTAKVYRHKDGGTAAVDTIGKNAKFAINWKLITDDNKGIIDSITILNGGEGYVKSPERFFSTSKYLVGKHGHKAQEVWSVEASASVSSTDAIDGPCAEWDTAADTWVLKDGQRVPCKRADKGTTAECNCIDHSTIFTVDVKDQTKRLEPCQTLTVNLARLHNTRFSVYAFAVPTDGRVLVEGEEITQHVLFGHDEQYPMVQKWKYGQDFNRKEVKVTLNTLSDEPFYLQKDLIEKYGAAGIVNPTKAMGDSKVDLSYLNIGGRGVNTKPFVMNFAPSASITGVKKDSFQGKGWEWAPGSGIPACTIERRPANRRGRYVGLNVLYGGEGCGNNLLYQVKANSSASWTNASLTVNEGVVKTAILKDKGQGKWLVSGHAWEGRVLDTYKMEEVRVVSMGYGFNKDSLPTVTLAKDSATTRIHDAKAEAIVDEWGRLTGIKVIKTGEYQGLPSDIWSKKFTVTVSGGTVAPVLEAIMVPSCEKPPQIEMEFEYDGLTKDATSYSTAHSTTDDATCEFVMKEVGCEDTVGTATNFTIEDVIITHPGRYYYADKVGDINYPRIKALSTSQIQTKYIDLEVAPAEWAEFDMTMTNGVISTTIVNAGTGYDKKSTSHFKIGMPSLKQVVKLDTVTNGGKGGMSDGLIGGVVVREGGKGYKDWHKLCCSPDQIKTFAYLGNGMPIGELTLDPTTGAVTKVEVNAAAWEFCGVNKYSTQGGDRGQFFVCGKKLKSMKHKNDAPASCGEWGTFDGDPVPQINVKLSTTNVAAEALAFKQPSVTAILADEPSLDGAGGKTGAKMISGFEVTDGGWFFEGKERYTDNSAGLTFTVKSFSKYELDGTTPVDNTVSVALKNTKAWLSKTNDVGGKQLSTSLKYEFEFEEAGEGAILHYDDTLWLLRDLNAHTGKDVSAQTNTALIADYATTFDIDESTGKVTGVTLARTGAHTFTDSMLPIEIQVRDLTAAHSGQPFVTYKRLAVLDKEDLNADGSIPDTLVIHDWYSSEYGDKAAHHWGKTGDTTGQGPTSSKVERIDRWTAGIAEHPPRGRMISINKLGVNTLGAGTNHFLWGNTNRYQALSAMYGARLTDIGILDQPLIDDSSTEKKARRLRRHATSVKVGNGTIEWTYQHIRLDNTLFKLKRPAHPVDDVTYKNASRQPFSTKNDIWDILGGGTFKFEVTNYEDITDSSVVTNVTRWSNELDRPRFRVCPNKHDYYERIDFEVEVLRGNGQAAVKYMRSDHDIRDSTKQKTYVKQWEFPENLNNAAGVTWFGKTEPAPNVALPHKVMCWDVYLEWDEHHCSVNEDWSRPKWDREIEVRLTSKVTYYGGECTTDDQCIDRNYQGGATKASLAVRASANSDPDRFTMCYVGSDTHNPTCKECSDDCDCGAGQYCFLATPIIAKYKTGKYAKGPELAWAESQLVKHMTCQKKKGLLEPCGSNTASDNNHHNQDYRWKHTNDGDQTFCGESLYDYDGKSALTASLWPGKCVNHLCVECGFEEKQCGNTKFCNLGVYQEYVKLDMQRSNPFIKNSAKLQTDNQADQAKAATRVDMLTDIMGATLLFVMVSTLATVISTMLLAGRCASCRQSGGSNKVTPSE